MRRRILLLLANSLLGFLLPGTVRSDRVSAAGNDVLNTLVDTIVPRDDTAGALDAGVGELMARELAQESRVGRALATCMEAAESLAIQLHGEAFSGLEQRQREQLFLAMLNEPADAMPSRKPAPGVIAAARLVRRTVIRQYYLGADGQASTGYTPPWPRGYRDELDG